MFSSANGKTNTVELYPELDRKGEVGCSLSTSAANSSALSFPRCELPVAFEIAMTTLSLDLAVAGNARRSWCLDHVTVKRVLAVWQPSCDCDVLCL